MTSPCARFPCGMLASTMSAPKKTSTKTAPKKTPPAADSGAEGRKKSKLTQIGDDAKKAVMRKALLAELRRQGWNLTRTAEALDILTASAVIRAIKDLGLDDEYEAARRRGDVAPGRPT